MIFIFIFIFYFSCSEFSSCWVVGKMPVRMFLHREQRNFIVVCCAMWRRMFRFRLIITRVRTNKQTNKLSPPRDSQIATTERSPTPGPSPPTPSQRIVVCGEEWNNLIRVEHLEILIPPHPMPPYFGGWPTPEGLTLPLTYLLHAGVSVAKYFLGYEQKLRYL
jgi:hypothetical protein